jgi:sigma-B regulation protein RsbU (phosphoserine phosphatase)
MGHLILSGLVVVSLIVFFWLLSRLRNRIADLEKNLKDIKIEEGRVFDFLHGLGEAFTSDIRPEEFHRLIVASVVKILDAHGGALYLMDRQGAFLIARFISKGCPPLIEVPAHILQQVALTPQALQSYIRLHSIAPGEGVIGSVWKDKLPCLLSNHDPKLEGLRDTSLKTKGAMFAPLVYGKQNLGVIAVANGPMGQPFSESDFAVFKAIAEQSAFALYNAIVYSQADEKKRLDLDIQVAQDIQRILLPSSSPSMVGYEIDGINMPARQMSGDYYGYIKIDDHRWGAAIGDVSGKGVPASLIMAMCRTVLRSQAVGNPSAADVLHKVNRQLFPDIKEDMFISMAYVILDEQSNRVTLCRAGHDAPLFYSAKEQTVSKLNPSGMALGIDSGDVFDRITGDFSFTLEPNDCLILYTDGVTEALDSKGLEFGMKRMIQSIQASAPRGASAIKKRLTDDIVNFIGTDPQNDDITMIVIRKK